MKTDPYFKEPYHEWLIEDERKATDAALAEWRAHPTKANLRALLAAVYDERRVIDQIDDSKAQAFSFLFTVEPHCLELSD